MSAPREIKLVSVRKIRPNKRNARTHSKKQIRQIANSILRFGWTYGILIDEHGVIIAGHGRYYAALLLGLREVPAMVVLGLSDTEKRALALADNKISANAGWDRELLAAELGELAILLPECNIEIEITGFEPAEIDGLLGDLADGDADPSDVAPPLEKHAISKPGDLWELGSHRLLCGNSLIEADVRSLMGSACAIMVITDPPYNVKIPTVQGRGKVKHSNFALASGEMTSEQFTCFLRTGLAMAVKYTVDGAIHFVFMDWRHIGELQAAGAAVYSELRILSSG